MPTTVTPADLAQQITDYVAKVAVRDGLFYSWMTGAADGGVNHDGVFPLTDLSGFTRYLESPAKIMAQATTGFAARYATKAELDGAPPGFIPGTMVLVYDDPDNSKNGPYVRLGGGGWEYAQWFYDSLAQVVQAAATNALTSINSTTAGSLTSINSTTASALASVNNAAASGNTQIASTIADAIVAFNAQVMAAAASASSAAQVLTNLQALDSQFRSDFAPLVGRVAANETKLSSLDINALSTLLPQNSDIGELLFALLDAAGYLGAGLGKDGTWAANKLRALSSISAPSLTTNAANLGTATSTSLTSGAVGADTVTAKTAIAGLLSLLAGGSIAVDDKGSISRAQGGVRMDIVDADYPLSITDADGNILMGYKDGVTYTPGSQITRKKSQYVDQQTTTFFNGVQIDIGNHNYDFSIADVNGNVLLGWMNGIYYGAGSSGGASATDTVLDRQDAANKTYTQRLHSSRVNTIQRPSSDYNVQVVYGQSLGQGDETWPALSRTNRFGNLMYGASVQPSSTGTTFTPQGGSGTLQPLVAVTINTSGVALDQAGEAALAPGNGARGEPINHGWANGSRFAMSQYLLDEDFTKKRFVSINASVSGATIGELEKNHSEGTAERYGRYSDGLTRLKAIATSESKSISVAGIGYMQGEHDYFQASGHNSLNITYDNYKAKLVTMIANMQGDAITTMGQTLPPAFLIYQTGAAYTRDADINGVPGMHVGMAQLDVALASTTAWMVGPVYPYTDKGGHLDSNGSRWFGHQFAKVYEHVVLKGKGWEPLRPLRVWKDPSATNIIYVGYHVPAGPLVFDEPQLSGGTEYNNASKGFRVTDSTGAVGISDVAIVRDTIIRITCSRALTSSPKVWYASQGTSGNGMVRDSDPSLAIDKYVYETGSGMYASANIAQFVDKPYPLWNWSVGFYLPVEV